jgi:hypothetical protein
MARRSKVKAFPNFSEQSGGPINTLPERVEVIPVSRIVGSVDKAEQLTPTFLPKDVKSRSARYRSVQRAMLEGVELPPIEVYLLDREYYVIDGHNRTAAAIANGVRYLDAIVHECVRPKRGPAGMLAAERQRFERRTGLTRIDLTRPGSYDRLLDEILQYRVRLRELDPDISTRAAAQHWYNEMFVPIAEPLDLGAMTLAFPGLTVSDLYFVVRDHQAYLEDINKVPVSAAEAIADLQRLHPRPLTARVLRPLQRHARRAVWRMTGGPPAT